MQTLKEVGFTVAGIRREKFDGVYVRPSPPPMNEFMRKKRGRSR